MGRNLSTLFISQSYQFLTQISGSELQDGLGNTITGSLAITSSQAISASFATTASFALNAGTTVSTASLLTTASAVNNVITFTKGDASTFNVTVATGSGAVVNTGSLMVTGSATNNVLTFTKGDGSTFVLTVATGSAVSASFASTASLALNNVLTASISNATITFTKGDATTFPLTINNVVNATSASFATTASLALAVSTSISTQNLQHNVLFVDTSGPGTVQVDAGLRYNPNTDLLTTTASLAISASQAQNAVTSSLALNNVLTASVSSNTITFTKGDGSTFPIIVNTGSAVTVNTGSLLTTASISNATTTFTKGDGSTFSITANNVVNADSASVATSASFATTASFASTIASGLSPTFLNATASNVLITGTASVNVLITNFVSSSVIFSSGSNLLGDSATLDTQTLIGIVKTSGSLQVTGSADFANGITGSLLGTASFATSASYAISASQAQNAVSASFATNAVSASFALNAGLVPGSSPNSMKSAAFLTAISASAEGTSSIALGNNAISYADYSIIIGDGAHNFDNSRPNSIFIGRNAKGAQNALGIGYGAEMLGDSGIAIGRDAKSNSNESITIGYNADTRQYIDAKGIICIGRNTLAAHENEINIGGRFRFNSGSNGLIELRGNTSVSGSLTVTGSLIATNGFTGSLLGTASFASNVVSSSFASTSSFVNTLNQSVTISGSLNVSGSVTGNVLGNNTDTYTTSPRVQQVVTLTQAEYNGIGSPDANTLYIISGSVPFNSSVFATTGSNTFVGNQVISGSLNVTSGITGSLLGTASFATSASQAVSSSFATSASLAQTASFYSLAGVTQNAVFSGSVRGEVRALSISSQTASLDCSTGNFYTLTLVSGSTTFVNPSNILPGQTINLRVKQASVASGSISFASSVKQVSGSAYTPTATANAEDIITFISFDSTNLYLSNIKNFV